MHKTEIDLPSNNLEDSLNYKIPVKLAEKAPEQLHRFYLDQCQQELYKEQAAHKWEEREPGSLKVVANAFAMLLKKLKEHGILNPIFFYSRHSPLS